MGGPGGDVRPSAGRPAGRPGGPGGDVQPKGGRGGYSSPSLPPLFSFSIPLPLLTPLLFTEEQYHIIQSCMMWYGNINIYMMHYKMLRKLKSLGK